MDCCPLPDHGLPFEGDVRVEDRIGTDPDKWANVGTLGVEEGDPLGEQSHGGLSPKKAMDLSQLGAGVDPSHLVGVERSTSLHAPVVIP